MAVARMLFASSSSSMIVLRTRSFAGDTSLVKAFEEKGKTDYYYRSTVVVIAVRSFLS